MPQQNLTGNVAASQIRHMFSGNPIGYLSK